MNRWTLLALVVAAGVALDQITKAWAQGALPTRGIVQVVEGYFNLRYARNPGAFFSLGAELPAAVRRVIFIVTTLLALGLILRLLQRAPRERKALQGGLMLLSAGALGNLVDRIIYGDVIDFLHLHWHDDFHWATFNAADVCLFAGLVLLMVDLARPHAPAGGSS